MLLVFFRNPDPRIFQQDGNLLVTYSYFKLDFLVLSRILSDVQSPILGYELFHPLISYL